jgi:N-acetylglutamate synthase-like GNAT family acetyltransferase
VSRIALREAVAADAEHIAALIDQLGYPVSAEDVAERLNLIEASGQKVLVAELDGRAIGCLSTSTMTVLHRPAPVGRISMMVIAEDLRGQGIGAKLVAAAERTLRDKGCQLVEVTSNLRRTDAHRFWERIGYDRTSVRFAKDIFPREGNGG